ncbi:MAG: DUF3971 domain-containing protein [Neomegalonema sp.]|nr:DUF3971 domain-containing protein [Neomegalonema sp.]
MLKLCWRGCVNLLSFLLLFVSAVVLIGIGRLAAGPVPLKSAVPELQRAVNEQLGGWQLSVQNAALIWDREIGDVGLRLDQVRLLDDEDHLVSAAPEALVQIDIGLLLRGEIALTEVRLRRPQAMLVRSGSGKFRYALGAGDDIADPGGQSDGPASHSPEPAEPSGDAPLGSEFDLAKHIVEGMAGDRNALPLLRRFRQIRIVDARLTYLDEMSGAAWFAPNSNTTIARTPEGLSARMSASLHSRQDRVNKINLEVEGLRPMQGGHLDLKIAFDGATGAAVAEQVPALDFLQAFRGAVAGQAQARMQLDTGDLAAFSASLSTHDSTVVLASDMAGPGGKLHVEALEADLAYDPARDRLTVSRVMLDTAQGGGLFEGDLTLHRDDQGALVSAKGKARAENLRWTGRNVFVDPIHIEEARTQVTFTARPFSVSADEILLKTPDLAAIASASVSYDGQAPDYQLKASFSGFDADRLVPLWPMQAAPGARAWVEEHIKSGKVVGGNVALRISPSQEALDLDFRFANVTSTYLKGMSPITQAHGSGHVTLERVDLSLESGQVTPPGRGALQIGGSSMAITELAAPLPAGDIDIRASGPARAALELIDQPPLGFIRKLGFDPASVSGTASSQTRVSLPLAKDLKLEQVQVESSAQLRNIGLIVPGLERRAKARRAQLTANTRELVLKGRGQLQGLPVLNVVWNERFSPKRGQPRTALTLNGAVEAKDLIVLGVPERVLREGNGWLEARISSRDARLWTIRSELNAERMGLSLPWIGWHKPSGEAGKIAALVEADKDKIAIREITADLGSLHMSGQASLGADGRFRQGRLDELAIGADTQVSLEALRHDGQLRLGLTGPQLDLRPAIAAARGEGEAGQAMGEEPALDLGVVALQVALDTVLLRGDARLRAVHGQLQRTQDGAIAGELSGKSERGAALGIDYARDAKSNRLKITSADAGMALADLGLMSDLEGGEMALSMQTSAQPPRRGSGKLTMRDVVVTDTPTIARGLAVASIFGAFDTLRTGGITFNNVELPFEIAGDVLTLRDGVATGISYGVAAEGTVDMGARKVDLYGSVSPFFLLGGALSRVPVLGEVLTGGAGRGIINMSFAARGTFQDLDVSTNPLSIIAPGPLNKVFEGESEADEATREARRRAREERLDK